MRDATKTPDAFASLPQAGDADGAPRRCGVEIEFSGLHEDAVAKLLTRHLGGTARQDGADWTLEDTRLGKLQVYLDTALRKKAENAMVARGLQLGRDAIPVEIVTEPLTMADLGHLDQLCHQLREAGAKGTSAALIYGFGVHLNVSVASMDPPGVTRPLLAYALIEDWMRHAHPIDDSRRLLPFTAPYPTSLVRALARAGADASLRDVSETYLHHAPSRNHGLDMLPILAHRNAEAVTQALGQGHSVSARPAFHFRLPDSRIDEDGWSLRHEWRRWHLVETIAADDALLDTLCNGWLDDHGAITLGRSHWARRTGDLLAGAGVTDMGHLR